MRYQEFKDRIAIVTGGASGIGLATTAKLVSEGARVGVWDIRSDRLEACQSKFNGSVLPLLVDVSDSSAVEDSADELLSRFGAPHFLINNAGVIGKLMQIDSFDDAELDRVLAINLKSVFYVTRAFVRRTEKTGQSAIVNMSSIAARTGGMAGNMVYAATKGAIASLTVALAKELAPDIRVNALAPGVIDTEIQAAVFGDKSLMHGMAQHIPLGRIGTPEEVADAACWLLSSESAYVTGTTMDISGGR